MYRIIDKANHSKETKISSTLEIHREESEWKQDSIDKQYISKTFYVTAGANIKDYTVQISKKEAQDIGGIKITDMQNKEKNQFSANEKFKVLVPIRNMTETGILKLTVQGQVQTKPILYGVAPNSSYQDYALTAMTYEEGTGEKSDEYPENETKIIIIKQDKETKQKLEGVEFELLDENKNVVYSDLKTNQEGEIEINHLIPGKYYIRETKTREGYEIYEQLIDLQVALQEQYTIHVENNPEEKPKVEVEKKLKNKEVSSSTVKKLPVTGM